MQSIETHDDILAILRKAMETSYRKHMSESIKRGIKEAKKRKQQGGVRK